MDEREIEMAEMMTGFEADAGARRASAAVAGRGSPTCVDCGETIPAARRLAAPFARHCVDCQSSRERPR